MAKYLELSANVKVDSSAQVDSNNLGVKKVKPYYENGKMIGYLIRSPKSKRLVLIGLENKFNGDYIFPTFERAVSVLEDEKHPEEHFIVFMGQVAYLEHSESGTTEIIGSMPMIDCNEKG